MLQAADHRNCNMQRIERIGELSPVATTYILYLGISNDYS